MFLFLLGIRDSKAKTEKDIKMSFLLYLIAFAVGYSLFSLYIYQPEIYIGFTLLPLGAFLLMPILFYRSVWIFTDGGRNEPFPYIRHFSVAVFLILLLSPWLPFIPASIRADMLAGREIASDYHVFVMIYKCKSLVIWLFVAIYVILPLIRLINYYRAINHRAGLSGFPVRRLLYIAVISFIIPVVSAMLLIIPQNELFSSLFFITFLMFFVVLLSITGYNIICNRFTLYRLPVTEPEVKNDEGKIVTVPLTRKRFEEYMKEHKPYLNSGLKITDLIGPLRANRTVISNFINQTYGVNFNRYINHLRMNELERIKILPSNKDKNIAQLLSKTGFSSMRNYTRAIAAEQNNQSAES